MTDYRRMERHVWYNRIARWTRYIAVLAMANEVYWAIKYHFPLWDDIAMPLTLLLHQGAYYVQIHTDMYRAADPLTQR